MSRKRNRRERRAVQTIASQAAQNAGCSGQIPTREDVGNEQPAAPMTPLERLSKLQDDIAVVIAAMHPRHVKFARLLAEGSSQGQAAADAGYAPANARQQGSALAARADVMQLVEALQMFDILTEGLITRPALRQVLGRVMKDGSHSDQVKAVNAAMKLQGYDHVRVEVTGGVGVAMNPEELRKQLAERIARQRAQTEGS